MNRNEYFDLNNCPRPVKRSRLREAPVEYLHKRCEWLRLQSSFSLTSNRRHAVELEHRAILLELARRNLSMVQPELSEEVR